MDFVKSDDPAPPADTAPWVRRSLPDNWRQTNPGLSGYGWYRARFVLREAPSQPWAAYLPTVGTTYQMHLNGVDIGTGGGITGPIARTLGVPRLDPIAPQLLRPGENRLLVRLRVAPNLRGGLGPITLGPRAVVEPVYDADFFARVTLPRSLNIALIFAGMLVLLLWLRRPAERIHGYFAALAIVWSIRNFHYTCPSRRSRPAPGRRSSSAAWAWWWCCSGCSSCVSRAPATRAPNGPWHGPAPPAWRCSQCWTRRS